MPKKMVVVVWVGGHRYQWISATIKGRHPCQLKKKSKYRGSFELQAKRTAMPIQPIWLIFAVNGLDWLCCLASSFKTDPKISIFSIAMDADYLFELKSIETHAPNFLDIITYSLAD